MFWNAERKTMVLCSCGRGDSKRWWLKATPEEREKALERRKNA
jgi:hypothetical protein